MKNLSHCLNKKILSTIIIASIVGAIVGGAFSYGLFFTLSKPKQITDHDRIRDFYLIENAVHISPHSLRKKMDEGDTGFVLVDLRSGQEYEKAHIVGAVNISAYKDPETSAYDEEDRIVGAFKELPQNKDVIVYCYSTPCMTGRKIGKMLTEHNIYVKHLGIGWNEWRYFWNLWNHDGESPSKMEDYVVSGKEPGTPKLKELPSPCGDGTFGC